MSLMRMTTRRVKSLIAWVLAAVTIVLLVAGAYYIATAL